MAAQHLVARCRTQVGACHGAQLAPLGADTEYRRQMRPQGAQECRVLRGEAVRGPGRPGDPGRQGAGGCDDLGHEVGDAGGRQAAYQGQLGLQPVSGAPAPAALGEGGHVGAALELVGCAERPAAFQQPCALVRVPMQAVAVVDRVEVLELQGRAGQRYTRLAAQAFAQAREQRHVGLAGVGRGDELGQQREQARVAPVRPAQARIPHNRRFR